MLFLMNSWYHLTMAKKRCDLFVAVVLNGCINFTQLSFLSVKNKIKNFKLCFIICFSGATCCRYSAFRNSCFDILILSRSI